MKHDSIKLIIVFWCIITFVLMKCYSGVFVSLITVPAWEDPIETIQDIEILLDKNDCIIYTARYLYDIAINAQCCSFEYKLGQNMKRLKLKPNAKRDFLTGVNSINKAKTLLTKKFIYITPMTILEYYCRHYTFAFHISSSNLYMDMVGILHQKDALYSEDFSVL